MSETEPESTGESETGLRCPDPNCDERFHSYHDEHRISTLITHLDSEHPTILANLKTKLGVDR